MKNISKKSIIILVISILILTPTISAISNINQNREENIRTEINATNVNSKIIDILDKINESMLKEYLRELVEIGPRYTGTYGCEKAADYIKSEFIKDGLEARFQPWTSIGNIVHLVIFKSENVIATHKGTDESYKEEIIFNAHYDTVRKTPGANDDGSGVAAVLAAAYVLGQYDFKRTINFVTFSGEEIGLRGSRAYAKEIYEDDKEVLVEFNADMIGRATSEQTGHYLRLSVSEDAHWIADLIGKVSNDYNLNFNMKTYNSSREGRGGSDYFEFLQYGYETVAFWQGEGDPNMHKPTDTLDKINFSYLANMTKHIVGAIAILADSEITTPQIKIVNPRHGRVYRGDRTLLKLRYNRTILFKPCLVCTEVKPGNSTIDRVEFYYDGKLLENDTTLPYQCWLDNKSFGRHKLIAVLYDDMGRTATDQINFFHILKP